MGGSIRTSPVSQPAAVFSHRVRNAVWWVDSWNGANRCTMTIPCTMVAGTAHAVPSTRHSTHPVATMRAACAAAKAAPGPSRRSTNPARRLLPMMRRMIVEGRTTSSPVSAVRFIAVASTGKPIPLAGRPASRVSASGAETRPRTPYAGPYPTSLGGDDAIPLPGPVLHVERGHVHVIEVRDLIRREHEERHAGGVELRLARVLDLNLAVRGNDARSWCAGFPASLRR